MKYYLIFLIFCGLVFGAVASLTMRSRALVPNLAPQIDKVVQYTNATEANIKIIAPLPGSELTKEFTITGSARGSWYFEASFPITIVSKDGEILAQLPAQATGDWMTSEFVPFKVKIKIVSNYVGPATITLKKDNPSGLPEHDASASFDVSIK